MFVSTLMFVSVHRLRSCGVLKLALSVHICRASLLWLRNRGIAVWLGGGKSV